MIKLQIIGNIGKDAIIRSVDNRKVISFSVADNYRFKDEHGETVERTTWVNCSLWRDADTKDLQQYLTAGTKVYVEGVPRVSVYQDDRGRSIGSLDLIVQKLELLHVKRNEHPEADFPDDSSETDNVTNQELPY